MSSSLESRDISYEDIVQSSSPPLEGKCAVQRSVYCTSGRPTSGMCRLYECVADRVLAVCFMGTAVQYAEEMLLPAKEKEYWAELLDPNKLLRCDAI